MSDSTNSGLWNDGLKLVSYCPLCETRYNPMRARVLGETEETHLLHVTCKKCQNSILAVVLTNDAGVSSVGLITDLTFEDVIRFQQAGSISIDDVIEFHRFLEDGSWRSWRTSSKKRKAKKTKRTVRKQARKNAQ